jgi:hypothetical protein
MVSCSCRCIKCKSHKIDSWSFLGSDGYHDMHHTCKSCNTHFDHLDGEIYTKCEKCKFP